MSELDLTPETFTADYVGEPGRRTFFLQARDARATHTYLVEKQQVSALADKLRELLMLVDQSDTVGATVPARDPALAIDEPVDAEWRVGTIGLAYEEESDRVMVFVQPLEQEEADDAPAEDEFSVRFVLRRDQVRSFVLHAVAIVDEGRPLCQLCGLPMDPGGHACPASNGHRLGG
jgi:uncharacterized repeat protein (TIGR03847 family)